MNKYTLYSVGQKDYYSYSDNKNNVTTIIEAHMFKNGGSIGTWVVEATAKCNPNDTYDYVTGVMVSTLKAEKILTNRIYDSTIALF